MTMPIKINLVSDPATPLRRSFVSVCEAVNRNVRRKVSQSFNLLPNESSGLPSALQICEVSRRAPAPPRAANGMRSGPLRPLPAGLPVGRDYKQ